MTYIPLHIYYAIFWIITLHFYNESPSASYGEKELKNKKYRCIKQILLGPLIGGGYLIYQTIVKGLK